MEGRGLWYGGYIAFGSSSGLWRVCATPRREAPANATRGRRVIYGDALRLCGLAASEGTVYMYYKGTHVLAGSKIEKGHDTDVVEV